MTSQTSYILAIESSCDDTAAAVLCDNEVLSNLVATQQIHEKYGGVVPELASRAHQSNIVPVVHQALEQAGITLSDLTAIAVTKGPGLAGSLLVGISYAKSLALALDIPLIGVHHMHAHIHAHFIQQDGMTQPRFPMIAMTVSGGHTQIVRLDAPFYMTVLGSTMDDAAGEAFDKTGKMLGLSYPAGPVMDKLAQQGNPDAFQFPIPKAPDYDFSFSGFKTSVKYFLEEQEAGFIEHHLNDLCASIQSTIVRILMQKLKKVVTDTEIKTVAIGGGVSANSALRAALRDMQETAGWQVHIPPVQYTTDNAAMIGISASLSYREGLVDDLSLVASPRLAM